MSRRVARRIDEWIDDNVWPGTFMDVARYDEVARLLADRCLAAIAIEGFPAREIDEEAPKLPARILAVVTTPTLHNGDDVQNEEDD